MLFPSMLFPSMLFPSMIVSTFSRSTRGKMVTEISAEAEEVGPRSEAKLAFGSAKVAAATARLAGSAKLADRTRPGEAGYPNESD